MSPPLHLCVEGWRGVGHSYALVNQQQLLELLEIPGLDLRHRDLPFAFAHWSRTATGAGFTAEAQACIDAIPPPGDTPPDCVLRVTSPFRAPDPGVRTLTFMATELGLGAGSFAEGVRPGSGFTEGGNAVVTPSEWSRARLIEAGLAAADVHVVPHGVDAATFYPPTPAERVLSRASFGIAPDEVVFLSIAAPLWLKGIDLILRGFALLRAAGRRVRLLVKDQRDVYGLPLEALVEQTAQSCAELLRPDVRAAITVVRGSLERDRLRLLYGLADCYLAPYRAEGFCLPALEAIACGTRPLVTAGGATDTFCDDAVAHRVPGTEQVREQPGQIAPGRVIEPDFAALVERMDAIARGESGDAAAFALARARVLDRFTWRVAAEQLASLAAGRPMRAAPRFAPAPPPPGQADLRALLARLRPRALAGQSKQRFGNVYDGGYVVPDCALDCDGVLSIGVGGDVSFDLAFAERGALIVQIDNTVDGPPVAHPNFAFHRVGWGPQSAGDMRSLHDLRAMLDAHAPRRTLLKFDIEGGEYDVLASLAAEELARYDVIVCELHDLHRLADAAFFARARIAIDQLTARHVPVHLHANNYQGMSLLHGVPVPQVIELTLLRDDLDAFPALAQEAIPGPLDRPNHPLLPDLCLTPF